MRKKKYLNWLKKPFDPTLFHHIFPSVVKFYQDFENQKIFSAPPQKIQEKLIFGGNRAHTIFAPLHVCHLFTAYRQLNLKTT